MSFAVDYSISINVDDAQHFTLTATILNKVKINSMQFSILVFNTEEIRSTNKYEVVFGFVVFASPGGTFTSGYNI